MKTRAGVEVCVLNDARERAMAQAVSRRPLTAEAQVRALVSTCGICGGQSGTGTDFYSSFSAFSCHCLPPWLSTLVYYLEDA
jgi:hypothetical protein